MNELLRRRAETRSRIQQIRALLTEAADLVDGKACVYATGSYGREESSTHSDLDLFIAGLPEKNEDGKDGSALSELDATCVKADLIRATRKLRIQEFSGDGRYLVHYSAQELIDTLGRPEDDAENTLTARLLLLLESKALLAPKVHEEIIKKVIDAYWRDYNDHADKFMPAFLSNDILRLWRTFCVNYEARTQRAPAEKKAQGKLKNYKLKHSRMLTCYSALLHLLTIYTLEGTVTPDSAFEVCRLTPTERLERLLAEARIESAHNSIRELMQKYNLFLEATDVAESELVLRFEDRAVARAHIERAYQFGDAMFTALAAIAGKENQFYRLLVV